MQRRSTTSSHSNNQKSIRKGKCIIFLHLVCHLQPTDEDDDDEVWQMTGRKNILLLYCNKCGGQQTTFYANFGAIYLCQLEKDAHRVGLLIQVDKYSKALEVNVSRRNGKSVTVWVTLVNGNLFKDANRCQTQAYLKVFQWLVDVQTKMAKWDLHKSSSDSSQAILLQFSVNISMYKLVSKCTQT